VVLGVVQGHDLLGNAGLQGLRSGLLEVALARACATLTS
jgi:hypothetical protein